MKEQSKDIAQIKWKRIFFPFWLSQLLSVFGSMLVQFTLIWWLTEKSGSAAVLATASLFGLLPELIIQPFAGAIIDRINRKTVIIIADAAIATASLVLALLFLLERVDIWMIYGIMVLRSIGGAFHFPAEQATIAMMVPENQLARIAGFNQATHGILNIISAPIGALILNFIDIEGALFLDTISAMIAITFVFFTAIPRQEKLSVNGTSWMGTILIDLRDGLRYLMDWKGLFILNIIVFIFKIASVPSFSLIPLFVYQELLGDVSHYSMIQATFGVGLIAGGFILSAWGGFKKHIFTLILGGIGTGVGFFLMGLIPLGAVLFMVPVAFVMGFMVSLLDGPLMAIIQARVESSYHGRVITLFNTIGGLSGPLGLALAGMMAEKIGLRFWFLASGGLIMLIFIYGLTNKQLMSIDEGPIKTLQ